MLTCRMYNELYFIRDTLSNRATSSILTLSNSQQSSSQSQRPISLASNSLNFNFRDQFQFLQLPLQYIEQFRTMMSQKVYIYPTGTTESLSYP